LNIQPDKTQKLSVFTFLACFSGQARSNIQYPKWYVWGLQERDKTHDKCTAVHNHWKPSTLPLTDCYSAHHSSDQLV